MTTSYNSYIKTKFKNFEPKKLIQHSLEQRDQFKMSSMRNHAVFENNFVSILDKHTPEKTKKLGKDSKTQF